MPSILVAGLEERWARLLEHRLAGARVVAESRVVDVANRHEGERWDLVVVDQRLGWTAAEELVRQVRGAQGAETVPVVAVLEPDADRTLLVRLINELGVNQLLFKPVDEDELLRQAAGLLNVAVVTPEPPQSPQQQVLSTMAALWDRFKDATIKRVGVLEEATTAILANDLGPELRMAAEREAHKLMGSLGTFGFAEGSRLAAEIDRLLRPGQPLDAEVGMRLSELLVALRDELRHAPGVSQAPVIQTAADGGARLLLVEDDPELGELLAGEARARGWHPTTVQDLATARRALEAARPDAILLDLFLGASPEAGRRLLAEASAKHPPIPVVVLTGQEALLDRVEVARLGGAAYLQKPMAPAQVFEVLAHVLDRRRAETFKVLAVDDDPQVLAAVQALVAPQGITLHAVTNPLDFWSQLEAIQPDLVMLDVDMPFLSGIELCRVLRNDMRWNAVPVLFLTGRTDGDTISRVFAAGADDYVSKPLVGPELLGRLLNRLERTQLLRRMAEIDHLTGVANRGHAATAIAHFLHLAERRNQPMAVAVLDLDRFKAVNDEIGHLAGDMVLRRLGELLGHGFRGEDVVARWGGGEFLVAMYGCTAEDAVRRLSELQRAWQDITFEANGRAYRVTFSAGVAEFPRDGRELQTLYLAADQAVHQAKHEGRDRLRATTPANTRSPR